MWVCNTHIHPLFSDARQAAPKDDACAGVRKLTEAIGQAYERAKKRGPPDEILEYMNHGIRGRSERPLVKFLVDKDGEFEPGEWYTKSKYPTDTNDRPFRNQVRKIQERTDFKWAAWLPESIKK